MDIGRKLLGQRELLGLSLEDVERHTHIRQHYLRALEAGNLEGLPSPVQGRGMLNNYASFLGLNSEALLLRFADGLQAQLQARRSADPQTSKPVPIREKTTPPSRLRKLLSPDILIGGSLVIFLGVFIVWGVIRIFAMTSETDPLPTAPSIAEILLATASPSQTSVPLPETPTPPSQAGLFPTQPVFPTGTLEEGAEPPASGGAAVQVYLTILQRAWMRVTVDGKIEFQGRVLAGSAYPFVGSSQVEVLTSNGAALQVFFNGTDVGTMGEANEIVDLVFIPQGAFPPTPTVTPTPAPTQPIIPTVPPAATLAPPPNP